MHFSSPYWGPKTKLDLLAKWLIVQSIIYYEIGTSIVEDHVFDNNAKQFVALEKEHPRIQYRWQYAMVGFDGSTGFLLYSKLNRADKKALRHLANNLADTYGELDKRQRRKKIKIPKGE